MHKYSISRRGRTASEATTQRVLAFDRYERLQTRLSRPYRIGFTGRELPFSQPLCHSSTLQKVGRALRDRNCLLCTCAREGSAIL
jgi:hypothetical protein